MVELKPTPAPQRPNFSQSSLVDDATSSSSTTARRRQSNYGEDLLSLNDDVPAPPTRPATVVRSSGELLSLYDQAPCLKPSTTPPVMMQRPIMLSNSYSTPINPFAQRPMMGNSMSIQPTMTPQMPYPPTNNNQLSSNNNTNNNGYNPTRVLTNRSDSAPTKTDPFSALNVLKK
jgi:hypothetical protein